MVPSNMVPNIVVDVSSVIDRTCELIRCYKQQMAIDVRGSNIEEFLKVKRAALGMSNGVAYAEPFMADEMLLFSPDTFFSV